MGKGSKPSAPNLRPELRGVVLIIVDSLRSDRITAHRAGQVLMPSLQRLGLRSLTFPNVYTTAPGTTRALASMLTSRFAGEVDRSTLEGLSLPSTLAAAGVRSIAVSGHEHLRNLTRMFDEYDDRAAAHRFPDYKNALTSQHTVAAARSWLERIADERFFLLVHFFDPHAHYVTNSLFDFGRSEEARYDAEVAHTDHWIGVLLSTLEYHEDIGVLVTSDHGDEFWEHRYKRHQLRLYDETTRVPLLIADPRSPEANVNTLDTSLIDIAPTVLQMLSVPRPPSMRGRALIGSLTKSRARTGIPIHVQSTNDRKRAVVINRRKLIFDSQTAIVEYYDLKIDPAETRNLADRNSLKQRQLECALETWMQTQNL
jgi:arylsulfatase A-like enzyme